VAVLAVPNLITLLRLLCSPLLVWLLVSGDYKTAFVTTILAGVTDWLDGLAARHFHSGGKLGILFDPLADKALLVTLFVTLTALHFIPGWLLWLVIVRDLVIVTGALLVRWRRGIREFRPSLLGKVSTFFQILYVLFVLLETAFPYDRLPLLTEAALFSCAIFTALSGLNYVRIGIGMARRPPVAQAI
jgi:cardiolipin synthase (CMP-forming)